MIHVKKCCICGGDFETIKTAAKLCKKPECKSEFSRRTGKNKIKKERFCEVCGKRVEIPRWSCAKHRSCGSAECHAELRRRQNEANGNAAIAVAVKKRAALPQFAPGPENQGSKRWTLRSPDGAIYEVVNLTHFVRTHPHLFTGDELKRGCHGVPLAVRQLQNLRSTRKRSHHHDQPSSWHGWKLINE